MNYFYLRPTLLCQIFSSDPPSNLLRSAVLHYVRVCSPTNLKCPLVPGVWNEVTLRIVRSLSTHSIFNIIAVFILSLQFYIFTVYIFNLLGYDPGCMQYAKRKFFSPSITHFYHIRWEKIAKKITH